MISIRLPHKKIWLCNECCNQLSLRAEIQKELHTIVEANNLIDSKPTEWSNHEIRGTAFAHFINNAHESIDKALGRIKVLDPKGEWWNDFHYKKAGRGILPFT